MRQANRQAVPLDFDMDSLLHTRFEAPNPGSHLVRRPHLMDALTGALHKRIIMISAPAGYGKTSLLVDWLRHAGHASAWLSLDPEDNDLSTFLSYFISALQTAQPRMCKGIQTLLKSPRLPPLAQLSTQLINELAGLTRDVIFVLEDYHLIRDPAIHQLIAALVYRRPRRFHLVISTRTDPPLPLLQWRAHDYIKELRALDLRFSREEAGAFLDGEIGVPLPDPILDDLLALTEGWITGLKLAAISIRDRVARNSLDLEHQLASITADLQAARTHQQVIDYLMEDVFSQQPKAIRDFLMRTSILDRFTAPLCDALGVDATVNGRQIPIQAAHVLRWIERANLFIVPLDAHGRWFRYHHLFRELLAQRLRRKHDAAMIADLHARAGDWLEKEGLLEEALQHFLKTNDRERAADLIERHRHALLNNDDWHTLDHWLNLLPASAVQSRAGLLLTRAWIYLFRGQVSAAQGFVAAAINCMPSADNDAARPMPMRAEAEALSAQLAFYGGRFEEAVARAESALDGIPREHAYVRGNALTLYGLSSQAAGRSRRSLQRLEDIADEDAPQHGPTALRALLTLAWIACIAGEWADARRMSEFALKQAEAKDWPLLIGWSHLFLGWQHYQHNELQPALEHFDAAAQKRYGGVHWRCAISSLCGLAMTQQAMQQPLAAAKTLDALIEFLREGGGANPMAEAGAFQAHLALLTDDVEPAMYWARTASDKNDTSAMIWTEAPLVTRLHAFVADARPESLALAKQRLQPALDFARATQNVWRQVELLALQACLRKAEARTEAALESLDAALTIAAPGRFIRAFVDLGEDMHELLDVLARRNAHGTYLQDILRAFDLQKPALPGVNWMGNGRLVEPLTAREAEILSLLAQHLTNGEIAGMLFISDVTVKSHLRNLFGKLGVNRRRFAVARAREMGLLPAQ